MVFVCLGICYEFYHAIYLEIVMLENIFENHGLPKFALGPPLGGRFDETSGRPWNLIHSPPCRTSCRLFIHEVFFRSLGLHLRVRSELGWPPPFWPMRALRLQWSWAFNLVCEVALTIPLVFYIALFRSVSVFYGTNNIMWNLPSFKVNVRNILHNIVSPWEYSYGSE